MFVHRHMRKNNKPVRAENLTYGQIFKKKDFIWLVWGNSFMKQLFRTLYTQHRMIIIFQEKIIPNNLKFNNLHRLPGYGGAGEDLYYYIAPI